MSKITSKTNPQKTSRGISRRELASERNSSHAASNDNHELYVCVTDTINKRKSLLNALKSTLVIQEDCELVYNLRKERYDITDFIKKEISIINTKYSQLQKLLPNVKGVISYAEKEIDELHKQISILSTTKHIDEAELKELEKVEEQVAKEVRKPIREKILDDSIKKVNEKTKPKEVESSKHHNIVHDRKESVSKLQRIKNNLSVIEGKLKDL